MTSAPPAIAICLVSGGLDSAVTLAEARAGGRRTIALTFDYGQRHRVELEAARRVADSLGAAEHLVAPMDLRAVGGSALTDEIPVPHDRLNAALDDKIPVTYVPARNLLFLSYAAGVAEARGASEIWIGVNAIDYSGYPDCREEFIRAFERCLDLGTRAGVEGRPIRVRTPLVHLSKAEIIRRGVQLGVDFGLTHSCYDPAPDGAACGRCDSCLLRKAGFEEAGLADPALSRA